MHNPISSKSFLPREYANETDIPSQIAELAMLIDAMPSEYRGDVLLAALRLSTSEVLIQSYLVSLCREQLSDCLMQETATVCDFSSLRQLDHNSIERATATVCGRLRPSTSHIRALWSARFPH